MTASPTRWLNRSLLDSAILFAPAMPAEQEDWDQVMVEGRPGGLAHLLSAHRIAGERLAASVKSVYAAISAQVSRTARRYVGSAEGERRPGVFARTWPIGITALWIVVLLTSYIFFYYL